MDIFEAISILYKWVYTQGVNQAKIPKSNFREHAGE